MEEKKEVVQEISENTQLERIKEAQIKLNELMDVESTKNLVEDNIIPFDYKDEQYRVRKPTFREKQEVYRIRCERQVSLLQELNEKGQFKYLAEKDLINLYKKREIDIDAMTRSIRQLSIKENEFLTKLGKELKETQSAKQLEFYKEEIKRIREQVQEIIIDKNSLLEFSIENQLLTFIYNYFTYLATEKKVKDKDEWIKVWNNYEEFLNAEEKLIGTASMYLTILMSDQIK